MAPAADHGPGSCGAAAPHAPPIVPDNLTASPAACTARASGILTFGVEGGRDGGARFQDALKLFTRLVNIGDAKSLACHPASTTHRQLAPAELVRAGVSEDMVRLSVGIEHVDDLRAGLEQALAAV